MKTLTTITAWILIWSTTAVSSATEHPPSYHQVSHHGDSIPQQKYQNTIVPFGVQIPENVLSTHDVACVSADSNIFEIMNKAQETCNGTDLRCTFYHFLNHNYQNIGTLDVDKQLFDDLLMKFDNWLLTAENIGSYNKSLHDKTKEDSFLDTADASHINDVQIKNSTHINDIKRLYTNPSAHIDKVDGNNNGSDAESILNTHHIKNANDTHHKNHHHHKNGNHIKLVPEYNNEHRYFEVFLPKDKDTGKPRTIYVEVNRDTNEFVLLDEEIDKKLHGIKPIKIELDELSEIADTAFNDIAKISNHKQHISNSNNDVRIKTSNINTNSTNEDITNLDIDIEDSTQINFNTPDCNPNICNINVNQQLVPDNPTGNVKKTVFVNKNLVVPNKYINQAQFYVESQIDNTTDEMADDHMDLLESANETDIQQTSFYEETPIDSVEFSENNTNIDFDLDNMESLENFEMLCDDNSTDNYEFTTEHDNVTFYDGDLHLEDNNSTIIDIDSDDTHDYSSIETIHISEPISQIKQPVQEDRLQSTPYIDTELKLTAGISDNSSSQLVKIPPDSKLGSTDLQNHFSMPSATLSQFTTVPTLSKDLENVLETDARSEFLPAHAPSDIPADASQNPTSNSVSEHPSITYFNSPLESDSRPKLSTIFPSPPVECVVKLNKGSTYSPLNFGFSWLPSYSRIEELRLPPCAMDSPLQGSSILIPEHKNNPLTDCICLEPPDPRLFQTAPSLSVNIQDSSSTPDTDHLNVEAPIPPTHIFPSKLDVPKCKTDLDRLSSTDHLTETSLASVIPYSLDDLVDSPLEQIPPYLQPTKPNQTNSGFNNYPPFDNNSKDPMIPYSQYINRIYPYTSIPCFANPYLKPQYLEPLLPVTQPASKIPTIPISLDPSNQYMNGQYPRETKPMSLLPNIAFSPLTYQLIEPSFVPNTSPCHNLWNNIPYLPYTVLTDQNIRNYPPIVNNYIKPSAVLQQNEILKPLLSKAISLPGPDQACPIKNISEIIPSSYTPFLPMYTPPAQKDLNPTSALERDLQNLSLKYGIPLSKILNSLEKEMVDVHSTNSSATIDAPYTIITNTYAVTNDENRSGDEQLLPQSDHPDLIALDSSLIGPHLEIEGSLMPETKDSQYYTVLSETEIAPTIHSGFENQTKEGIKDSSLIGPHLSTSNVVLSDENRNEIEMDILESDIFNLSSTLDASLIGPHLEIGNPPVVLHTNNSRGDFITSETEIPITISSKIEPKLNLNEATNLLLDSSLIGTHLPPLSAVKPLLSNELQMINDMIPVETDLTDLEPVDSTVIDSQEDYVNKVILSAANISPELHLKPFEYLPTNLVGEELQLKTDSSRLIPLDSSLIGPGLKLGNSPIIINAIEDKTVPAISPDSIEYTDINVEESEHIILPSSLLSILLNKPVESESNLNFVTQDTKLNEELDESSFDSNELPLTDISIPLKENDFEIVEPILEVPSLKDENNIPLITQDFSTIKHKLKSPDNTHVVDSESLLDNSLTGPSILHKLENPEIPTILDSSIHLDSSLIGPKILHEIPPILDSVNHFQSSLEATTINQNTKPPKMMSDASIQLESSLIGPSIYHEINSKETSTAFNSVSQLKNSLVPSLHETKEVSATSSDFGSKSQLDSSLIGPSLKPKEGTLEVSRAFDIKDLDSSLTGPHISTVPFSLDDIEMINGLEATSSLANSVPLDSSLVGPHVDYESELEELDISRNQNPESSLLVISPDVFEATELSYDLEGEIPLESISLPSTFASDRSKLLTKFTKPVTKSQLKPRDDFLLSIAKTSSGNSYTLPSCDDLQTLKLNTLFNTPSSLQDELASEFYPITMTAPAWELSPVGSTVPCHESNWFPTPKTPNYAQGVAQIPFTPYSPFVQKKPYVGCNWLVPQTLNIQNNLHTSPSLRPAVGNAPASFISNALPFSSDQDLVSHRHPVPQLLIPNMCTLRDANTPPLEWTTPSYILPIDKHQTLSPKNYSPILPSNLQSTTSNLEYNPIVVDDVMSLLDEDRLQLLKDMSILPFSQSSLPSIIPVFGKGEIVSSSLSNTTPKLNSDFVKARPLLPSPNTNSFVPSFIYNPQNIPNIIQSPNNSPCNLEPYSNTPLHSQYSETVGPTPQLVTVPTKSPEAVLQPLFSKPCVESPIILPSSLLDAMLQLPTASNQLNSVPYQPISPMYATPVSNALTNPILPMYASPSSVSFAKSISTPSNNLPSNVPYVDTPLTLPLPIHPYAARPLISTFPTPHIPFKITPLTAHPYPSTASQNRPIQSEIPYKQSQTCSNAYLPTHASLIPINTSPCSPIILSKLPPAIPSLMSPISYDALPTSHFSPFPTSLTNSGLPVYSGPLAPISLSTLEPTPTSLLSPSYLSPDIPTNSLPAPINTPTRPSNLLSPTYMTPISPVSSNLKQNNRPFLTNSILNFNPQFSTLEPPTLQPIIRPINALSFTNAAKPTLNAYQNLLLNTNQFPIQSYSTSIPKLSKIKQNIPIEDALESNLQILPSTGEAPSCVEEDIYTYSNGKDEKYYEEPNFKYPLESLSYTIEPEKMLSEDFITGNNLNPSLANNIYTEPYIQTKLYQHHRPMYPKPSIQPRPAPKLLSPQSFTEIIPESIFDNTQLLSYLQEHPVSLSSSHLCSPLLETKTPLTSASSLFVSSPLLPRPSTDTSAHPYNKLPITKNALVYTPYNPEINEDMWSPPIDPRDLKNIVSSQVTPAFSQNLANEPLLTISSPDTSFKSQPQTSPSVLDNYFQLPSTYYEPYAKTFTSQGSLAKPSSIPHYYQYVEPIIPHIPSLEMPNAPLKPTQNLKKTKPFVPPQFYSSSALPALIPWHDSFPLNEAPMHYQPSISPPTAFTNAANNIFKTSPTASPNTMLPTGNMVEAVSTDLETPPSSFLSSQNSLQSSFKPVSKYSTMSPHTLKQALAGHIIPSSLFTTSDIDFQTPTHKLSPLHPSKSYPSLSVMEPLETVPFYTPSRPLDTTSNPQNILKPKTLPSIKYTLPMSLSAYLTQPLQSKDSNQTQSLPNEQNTVKTPPKLSPVQAQYASPASAPNYLEKIPNRPTNKPIFTQYSSPVYDSSSHSPPGRNAFVNPGFKRIEEVPSYPVPKNIISTLTSLSPTERILLSNLKPVDISEEPENLYSSPITSLPSLSSSSLLKTTAKILPQKPRQYQPHMIPSNSPYVSQLASNSMLKPSFSTSENNVPLLPIHFSKSNIAFPEGSETSSDIVPSVFNNNKYSTLHDSMVSEIPEIVTPINPSSATQNIFLKTPLKRHFQSPVNTPTDLPLYSIYDILEPASELPVTNIVNSVEPVGVSPIRHSESSPPNLNLIDANTIEKSEPYELIPDLEDTFLPLPLGSKQHRSFHPNFTPKYLGIPQPSKSWSSSTHTAPNPKPPSSIPSAMPEEVESIDTTDWIPISQIKYEPLTADYSPIDRKASKIPEHDIIQLSPYTTLLNTEFPSPTYKQLSPTSLTTHGNKLPQPSPIFLSPEEYKDLIQGRSLSQVSSSSPTVLASSNPQLSTNTWTEGPKPQISFDTSPISTTPDWLQSATKALPLNKNSLELIPEKDDVQTFFNNNNPNEITQLDSNNYPYEPEYSLISEVPSEPDSVRPVTPLIKPKEHYAEYIEYLEPIEDNYDSSESDIESFDERQPTIFEAEPTKNLPEIFKSLSTPNYNNRAHRPQRLSKSDEFYANNYIGKSPQVFTAPTYNNSPISSSTDVKSVSSSEFQEILKDFTAIPTKHFGSKPKLDTGSHKPNEYVPGIADFPKYVPITNTYPQNYLNPHFKYKIKAPLNTIEFADASDISVTSCSPSNNIEDIKYSGYKTYRIPHFISPHPGEKQVPPPSGGTYSSPNPSKVQQNPNYSHFFRPTESYEPQIKMTTPLQTKLELNTLQETPELNKYNPIEDSPISVDSINEGTELKSILINYLNKRANVKNDLLNSNTELTIPIGDVTITRKEPYNAKTIETNNPSIGLKVWKSNAKIAEAELKLKFKDISVNNFMPVVNSLEEYDIEEIRKIVKQYIDAKYGNHIEVNVPYTIDNKYTVLKDFDHNSVDSKYNILWPTNYI